MKLRLDGGEQAEALTFDGRFFTLRSPQAFAPGSPIRFALISEDGERALEGRAIGSRRIDEESFEVRIRFVNLRRDARELLLRKLG